MASIYPMNASILCADARRYDTPITAMHMAQSEPQRVSIYKDEGIIDILTPHNFISK